MIHEKVCNLSSGVQLCWLTLGLGSPEVSLKTHPQIPSISVPDTDSVHRPEHSVEKEGKKVSFLPQQRIRPMGSQSRRTRFDEVDVPSVKYEAAQQKMPFYAAFWITRSVQRAELAMGTRTEALLCSNLTR